MSLEKYVRQASPVWLSLMLVACGGGGGNTTMEPGVGAASGSTDGTDDLSAGNQSSTISGRVADGYIQGATVCVDLNGNDSCDSDEPSTLTGEGGSYNLDIPAGAEDASIVADIPAEAIDEDTGEAVGKPLVFIAPAERPEFLSPITTLVHQEQQANPSLDIDEAEQSVKSILGIAGDDDVSLFSDYVAEGEDDSGDSDKAEKFRYLHDTARVVASLMKDIEAQVEAAAVDSGVDVAGDRDTQRAIREIVRSEVRELLPDIARQVAEIVGNEETTTLDGAEAAGGFDPDQLAEALRPEDAGQSVEERIDAVRDRVEVVQSDVKRMLTDGVYWMDFDCKYDVEGDTRSSEEGDASAAGYNDELTTDVDGQGDFDVLTPDCEAYYGHVQLNAAGDAVESEDYQFDQESGGWVMEVDQEDFRGAHYSLIDGEWVVLQSAGPEGPVEFLTDGTAVISNAEGKMQLKAVTQDIGATKVINYFWQDDANPLWFDLVDPSELFAAGSLAHKIGVRQSSHPYVLFNHQPQHEDDQAFCAQFGDNCNVVNTLLDIGQTLPVRALDDIRETSIVGMELFAHIAGFDNDGVIKLKAEVPADGSLPTMGTVLWVRGQDEYNYDSGDYSIDGTESAVDGADPYNTYPAGSDVPFECTDETFPDDHSTVDQQNPEQPVDGQTGDGTLQPEGDTAGVNDAEKDPDDASGINTSGEDQNSTVQLADLPASTTDADTGLPVEKDCTNLAVQTGGVSDNSDGPSKGLENESEHDLAGEEDHMLLSEWKLIDVDGVKMIEIQLPLLIRHGADAEGGVALLLIEHGGFVRIGERLPESFTDRVITYNETAFMTLRSITEAGFASTR